MKQPLRLSKKNTLAHLSILSANIIFGLNFTITKDIMPDFAKPMGLVVCRAIGAVALFWLSSVFIKKEKIQHKDFKTLIFCSIFGVVINQILFLEGLNYTTVINSAIIMTIIPVMVLVASASILNEKITTPKLFGIITGSIGAIILILFTGEISMQSETFIGNIMQFFNALSYGFYLVMIEPLMSKYHPITVMKWVFLIGAVIITPLGLNSFIQISWTTMPNHIILSIIYLIIFTTFLAYLLNVTGMKTVSSTVVSVYIYSQPVIASIVSVLSGKDSLNFIKLSAMLFVFIGVYLVSKRNNK